MTARPQCESSVSSYVSAPNVENVVYAPRNPTISPRESHDGAPSASTTSATSSPFRKHPETLIVNVDHGKSAVDVVLDQRVDAVARERASAASERRQQERQA